MAASKAAGLPNFLASSSARDTLINNALPAGRHQRAKTRRNQEQRCPSQHFVSRP